MTEEPDEAKEDSLKETSLFVVDEDTESLERAEARARRIRVVLAIAYIATCGWLVGPWFSLFMVGVPALIIGAAALVTRRFAQRRQSQWPVALLLVGTLMIGLGVWLANRDGGPPRYEAPVPLPPVIVGEPPTPGSGASAATTGIGNSGGMLTPEPSEEPRVPSQQPSRGSEPSLPQSQAPVPTTENPPPPVETVPPPATDPVPTEPAPPTDGPSEPVVTEPAPEEPTSLPPPPPPPDPEVTQLPTGDPSDGGPADSAGGSGSDVGQASPTQSAPSDAYPAEPDAGLS